MSNVSTTSLFESDMFQVTIGLQAQVAELTRQNRTAVTSVTASSVAPSKTASKKRKHVVIDSEDENGGGSIDGDSVDGEATKHYDQEMAEDEINGGEPATNILRRFTSSEIATIKVSAKKFTFMGMIWIRDPADTFALQPDDEYDPVYRFDDYQMKLQGQYVDLCKLVPSKFHPFFDEQEFQRLVKSLCILTSAF